MGSIVIKLDLGMYIAIWGLDFNAYILGVWYSVFLQDLDSHWEGGVCVCFGIVGEALL